MQSHHRPEETEAKAAQFFSGDTSTAYHAQNENVQKELTEACVSLLRALDGMTEHHEMFLDLGCGSGLSTAVLAKSCPKSRTIAFDISESMIEAGKELFQGTPRADVLLSDAGAPTLPFRSHIFDAIFSVSAVQWLTTAPKIRQLLREIQRCLRDSCWAIFQFYPTSPEHAQIFVQEAKELGLISHLVMDVPHRTPQKKWFLAIQNSNSNSTATPFPPCQLARPFTATCALCVKQTMGEVVFPSTTTILRKTKDTPMNFWLLRFHLIKALELIKNVKRSKKHRQHTSHPSFTQLLEEEQRSLQNLFRQDCKFDDISSNLRDVLGVWHPNASFQ